MEARTFGQHIFGEEIGMRPKTKLHAWPISFVFNMGGMGDFVNYAASTHWLMKNSPWVHGRIIAPRYLTPLMQDIHPKWECIASEDFASKLVKGDAIVGPDIHINGVNTSRQFLTVVGAHPIDVGFAYYAGTTPAPIDGLLPVLDYPRDRVLKIKDLGRYAVIPTGNVQASRKTTGKHINPLIMYCLMKNITPVFLGKRDPLGNGKPHTSFADDITYNLGVDLRDQTTVKEAACIMQHAEFTVGLDCGLLHLAALMKDSKVVFGYNITSVAHREPRRNHGKHVNVTLSESELKCIGCQSKLKQVAKHKFDQCLYGDTQCVDLLFQNEAEKFRRAIDQILEVN
jgi:hypothetical protein